MNMLHSDASLIKSCKERGFVKLDWEEEARLSGLPHYRAKLTGSNFAIFVTIGHFPQSPNPELSEKHYSDQDYEVTVMFNYMTALGGVHYMLVHNERVLENARDYAQWQATLLYDLLKKAPVPVQELPTPGFYSHHRFIRQCKEAGFIKIDWHEKVILPHSGRLSDWAELKGNRFVISLLIEYYGQPLKPGAHKNHHSNEDHKIIVNFTYYTELGKMTYSVEHRERVLDDAYDYAEWQATLLYNMFRKAEVNDLHPRHDAPINEQDA